MIDQNDVNICKGLEEPCVLSWYPQPIVLKESCLAPAREHPGDGEYSISQIR
jgi:hypothetical protein